MASKQQPAELKFTRQYQLLRPTDQQALPVPVDEWDQLMDRVRNCGDSSQFYEAFGWACLGVAGSAILSLVTFSFSVDFVRTPPNGVEKLNVGAVFASGLCAVLFLAGLAAGFLSLSFAKRHRKDRAELRDVIVEDMGFFRDRHARPGVPPTPSTPLAPPEPPAASPPTTEPGGADPLQPTTPA